MNIMGQIREVGLLIVPNRGHKKTAMRGAVFLCINELSTEVAHFTASHHELILGFVGP